MDSQMQSEIDEIKMYIAEQNKARTYSLVATGIMLFVKIISGIGIRKKRKKK